MPTEMKKYNKFETVYTYAKSYALSKKCGGRLSDRKDYDKTTVAFRRHIYVVFKIEVQLMFKVSIDSNPYVFNQNEIKTRFGGKESLKSLCRNYYFDQEALYLSSK